MYSAIEAEVIIPSDPSTHTDYKLIHTLKKADEVCSFILVLGCITLCSCCVIIVINLWSSKISLCEGNGGKYCAILGAGDPG